jgi:S1-C subfamily serine protease
MIENQRYEVGPLRTEFLFACRSRSVSLGFSAIGNRQESFMKLVRSAALAACLVVGGLAFSGPAEAQVDPRATAAFGRLDPWLRSVVMLRITCPTGVYEGAGVLVRATGEVLTAAHVGSECIGVTKAKVGRIQSLYAKPGEELTATLVGRIADSDETPTQSQVKNADFQDLALWKIDNMANANLTPATMAADFPMPGEPIEVVGFSSQPFMHPIVGTAGANQGPGLTRFKTSLISVGASTQEVPYRLHYPGFTLEGVSGGPIFNARGELIGIHSTRDPRDVESAIRTGCDTTDDKNCVSVMLPGANKTSARGTIGLDPDRLMAMLDNYSWATSIHAIPIGWLP